MWDAPRLDDLTPSRRTAERPNLENERGLDTGEPKVAAVGVGLDRPSAPPSTTAHAAADVGNAPVASRTAMAAVSAGVVGVAVVVSQTWFRPGAFIAQGDVPPFVGTSLAAEHTSLWNHDLTAAGSRSYQIVRSFEVLVTRVVDAFGGGDVVAQRAYYAVLLALVAFGAASFAKCFTSRPFPVAVAALFAFVNPLVLNQLPNPLVLAALAVMGISGALVVRAARGERIPAVVFGVVTMGFSYLVVNIPLLVVAVAWLALLVAVADLLGGPGGFRRAVGLLVRAIPWSVALNLWWLVPLAMAFRGDGALAVAVTTDIRAWAWTHSRASIANVFTLTGSWTWDHPEYARYAPRLGEPYWAWLRFIPAVAALSAPVLLRGRRRRTALALVAIALGLVFVGKGVHAPLADLNLLLYDHLPGYWLLREPATKAGPVLVLVYVALVALALTALLERLDEHRGSERRRLGVAAVLVTAPLALLAFPYPVFDGSLFPTTPVPASSLPSAHVELPEGWRAVAARLNSLPPRGKALVLPLADYYQMPTTWGFYGADVVPRILLREPAIQPTPGAYFSEEDGFTGRVRALEEALVRGRVEGVPDMLRALGVSHVVLRRDLDLTFPGRTFEHPRELAPALTRVSSLSGPVSFGIADVYEVDDESTGIVQLRSADGTPVARSTSRPRLTWTRRSPSSYSVEVSRVTGPVTLILAESHDPGWTLRGLPSGARVEHVEVDGYANGWRIDGADTFRATVDYRPARHARLGLTASLLAGAGAVATAISWGVRALAAPRRLDPGGAPADGRRGTP